MDDLKEIYERIKLLRRKGVKMKDIAESTGFTPSVLSALFTTVMPEYFKNIDKGMAEDEALDKAVMWVNNVSKKRLLGSLGKMKEAVFAIDAAPQHDDGEPGGRYMDGIARAMKGCLKAYEELDDTEKLYYAYTCGKGDALRMRDVPAPRMTVDDLAAEKELLG